MTELPDRDEWILARESNLEFYEEIPLYTKTPDGDFALYKKAGTSMADMRIAAGKRPREFYLKQEDKQQGIQEVQKGFNEKLSVDLQSGDLDSVKDALVNIVEETFAEPRSGSFEEIPNTLKLVVSGYAARPELMRNLVILSYTDYTTALHSVNVMALTIGYCLHGNYSADETETFGLSALLHDIGKIHLPVEILSPQKRLSDEEFAEMKNHPLTGSQILKECGLEIVEVLDGCLQHHERLDGSGYPHGTTDISVVGQILGIVDSYEVLTNDDRPYKIRSGAIAGSQDPAK